MNKMIAFLMLLGFTLTVLTATPDEVAQLWKERAFVALSRMETLAKKDDLKSRYQFLLENAFAIHAKTGTKDDFDFAHKIANDLDFYKIILNKGKNTKSKSGVEDAGLFVINFIYKHKTGDFVGTKIELLPKGWYLTSFPIMQNALLLDVNDNDIFIVFDLTNPMNSCVADFKNN